MNKDTSRQPSAFEDIRFTWLQHRWVLPFGIAALVLFYLLSGFYVIAPEEVGVVCRFGRVVAPAVPPGLHYHWPRPFEKLYREKVREVKRMPIGFKFIEQQAGIPPTSWETQFLTGDTNIINIQMIIQYMVRDPAAFLFHVKDAQWTVRKIAEAALVRKLAGMNVDEVLTTNKTEIQMYVKKYLQESLDRYGTGLQVVGATFQEVNAPVEVAPAFRDVASAKEDKQRVINDAYGYMNDVLPRAKGMAEKMIASGEADGNSKVKHARGEADKFESILAEYEQAPELTGERIYREYIERILSRVRKYIVGQKDDATSPVRLKMLKSQ
jgi:membrane protease subunit HflK